MQTSIHKHTHTHKIIFLFQLQSPTTVEITKTLTHALIAARCEVRIVDDSNLGTRDGSGHQVWWPGGSDVGVLGGCNSWWKQGGAIRPRDWGPSGPSGRCAGGRDDGAAEWNAAARVIGVSHQHAAICEFVCGASAQMEVGVRRYTQNTASSFLNAQTDHMERIKKLTLCIKHNPHPPPNTQINSYSHLHDITNCYWNPLSLSTAAGVGGNTTIVCTAAWTGIKKHLHMLPSHQTLGEEG